MANEIDAASVLAKALRDTLISPDECNSNLKNANAVDGLFAIARAIDNLANALREKRGTHENTS